MFLETEHLTKDHRDIDRVNQLYLEAFPDHERMPMNIKKSQQALCGFLGAV